MEPSRYAEIMYALGGINKDHLGLILDHTSVCKTCRPDVYVDYAGTSRCSEYLQLKKEHWEAIVSFVDTNRNEKGE